MIYMDVFLELFFKLIPLYGLILLGYLSGRRLNAQKETIALLLIYVITPVVVFDGAFRAQLDIGVLLLPFGVYVICCLFSGITKSSFPNEIPALNACLNPRSFNLSQKITVDFCPQNLNT